MLRCIGVIDDIRGIGANLWAFMGHDNFMIYDEGVKKTYIIELANSGRSIDNIYISGRKIIFEVFNLDDTMIIVEINTLHPIEPQTEFMSSTLPNKVNAYLEGYRRMSRLNTGQSMYSYRELYISRQSIVYYDKGMPKFAPDEYNQVLKYKDQTICDAVPTIHYRNVINKVEFTECGHIRITDIPPIDAIPKEKVKYEITSMSTKTGTIYKYDANCLKIDNGYMDKDKKTSAIEINLKDRMGIIHHYSIQP